MKTITEQLDSAIRGIGSALLNQGGSMDYTQQASQKYGFALMARTIDGKTTYYIAKQNDTGGVIQEVKANSLGQALHVFNKDVEKLEEIV